MSDQDTVSRTEARGRLVPVRAALQGGVRGGRGARQARGHAREGARESRSSIKSGSRRSMSRGTTERTCRLGIYFTTDHQSSLVYLPDSYDTVVNFMGHIADLC